MHKPRLDRVRPNTADPLRNATPQLRLWAAREKRGINRAEFSRKLGVAYTTVNNWDLGKSTMKRDVFLRACEVVGYSAEQIMTGHEEHAPTAAPSTADSHDAFARALAYVVDFLVAYVSDPRGTPKDRLREAHKSALRGQ